MVGVGEAMTDRSSDLPSILQPGMSVSRDPIVSNYGTGEPLPAGSWRRVIPEMPVFDVHKKHGGGRPKKVQYPDVYDAIKQQYADHPTYTAAQIHRAIGGAKRVSRETARKYLNLIKDERSR